MELLELFDVDFDFPRNIIRFLPPQKSPKDDLLPIPVAVLNESGLEGIRVRSPQQLNAESMLGIIDCGASFTTVNIAAAQLQYWDYLEIQRNIIRRLFMVWEWRAGQW